MSKNFIIHNSCFVILLLLVAGYVLLLSVPPAQAAGIIPTPTGSCPESQTCNNGICDNTQIECNYALSDFVQLFVNLAQLMLGVLGSVALLFFVIGGTIWLTAAGSQDRIGQGKKILSGAVMGIIIVLGAWTLINFIMGFSPEYKGKWWKIDKTTTTPAVIKKERKVSCNDGSECKSNTCWQHFAIPKFKINGEIFYGICVEFNSKEAGQYCIPVKSDTKSECKGALKCRDDLKSPNNDCAAEIECGGCG